VDVGAFLILFIRWGCGYGVLLVSGGRGGGGWFEGFWGLRLEKRERTKGKDLGGWCVGEENRVEWYVQEGEAFEPVMHVATVTGPMRKILLGERVALNTLARCSGIATK